jgi:hypothetical protein
MKLQPYEKKVITIYALIILALLFSAILLRLFFSVYEVVDWSILLSTNSYVILSVFVFIVSYFLVKKMLAIMSINKKNIFILLLIITFIINAMLLASAVMQSAKWFNAYSGTQQVVQVSGQITASYTRNKIKKRNKKRNRITIYDTAQQRDIRLETKRKYVALTMFNDTLIKGSLGFLYKKQ